MNILVIDASTEYEIVAVKTVIGSFDRTRLVNNSHSVTLFYSIEAALADAGITIRDIGLIASGVGPGSFTGIRIAVSTVRALAQTLDIPAAGIISQEIFAESLVSSPGDNIIAAFDAKKERVFGALYRRSAATGSLEEIIPPGDYSAGYLANRRDPGANLYLAGSGCKKFYNEIKNEAPDAKLFDELIPSGAAAAALAKKKFIAGLDGLRYETLLPLYARRSDAEIALLQSRGGRSL